MSYAVCLHNCIERYNILTAPTLRMNEFLRKHRMLYKGALLVNHVFRTAMMAAFLPVIPLFLTASAFLCFAGSLFYRLTVENNCAYKFALPSLAGAIAILIGQSSIIGIIDGAAFISLRAFGKTLALLLPLTLYAGYIALTVSYDVDQRLR
jgi:hypothetical protein